MILLFLFFLLWTNILLGQVCCSLVGAVDQGGGTSSSQWETHWPSQFDDRRSFQWLAGLASAYTSDNHLNIRYGNFLSIRTQVSHYVGPNNVGYFQIEGSWLQIEESLSFSKSNSEIQQLDIQLGIRHILPKNWGFVFGEVTIPTSPRFTNEDFPFRAGALPAAGFGWINHFQTPWANALPNYFPTITLLTSFEKNLSTQEDVYLDDAFYAHLSSAVFLSRVLSFSPFATLRTQKLLAPISPFESRRQSRWLSEINLGMDITPVHSSWDWLHLRFSLPISSWSSNGIFPDGTEPRTVVSLSMSTSGIFN